MATFEQTVLFDECFYNATHIKKVIDFIKQHDFEYEMETTNGKTITINFSDYLEHGHKKYSLQNTGGKCYAVRLEHIPYNKKKGITRKSPKFYYLHREILGLKKGDGKYSDHINGDTLNNTRDNLRIATSAQNVRNGNIRRKVKNKHIKYKGLTTSGKKFTAQIRYNHKIVYLGVYDTQREAAKAYDYAAHLLFKEFAKFNFPDEKLNKSKDIDKKITNFLMGKKVTPIKKSSQYTGVSKMKNKYIAVIKHNNKQMYLGSFIDEKEAALAYDNAIIKYKKDRNKLNFPNDKENTNETIH